MPASPPAAGAGASYAGYEYQFLATVWLALKLMWAQGRCTQITIEPLSQEDVGASLAAPDETSTNVRVPLVITELDVQIKRRSTAWTRSSFRDVLQGEDAPAGKRGPKPRSRPLDRLKAGPSVQYVFLTNAQLSSDLAEFAVDDIGERAAATALPIEPPEADAAALAARIAIVPEKPSSLLKLESEKMLRLHSHVPETQVEACCRELIEAVRLRVLNEAPHEWTKADLEKVILAHAGRLDATRTFVPPSILPDLEERLARHHRLLLTGVMGVGKTDLAYELARRQQASPEKFELVHSDAGVEAIRRKLAAPGAHLFLIEDPWGHDRLSAEASQWISELPKLFHQAGPTKRFLVTSRVGVRYEALTLPVPIVTKAEVELKPEHYSPAQRKEMMHLRLIGAQPWQRDWVRRHEDAWMRELDVPLAIDHFASRVLLAGAEPELQLDEVLRSSNVEALAATFAAEIRARGHETIAAALVLWALHQADGRVTVQSAQAGRAFVRTGGEQRPPDVEQVLITFVHAGWFRPIEAAFAAHPTALTGIETLLQSEPAIADDVMGALLAGLIAEGEIPRAFQIVQHLELRPSAVSNAVRGRIEDQLISDFLRAEGYDAKRALHHLSKHAVSEKPEIQFIRLLNSDAEMERHGFPFWRRPMVPAEQNAIIGRSERAREVARKFIATVLADSGSDYHSAREMVAFLAQFGWHFADDFTASAESMFRDYEPSSRVAFMTEAAVAAGTTNLVGLTDALFSASDRAMEMWEGNAADRKRAEQAEIDAPWASHLDEEGTELFSPISDARDTIVAARRQAEGWQWIVLHPRREDLIWSWAKAVDRAASTEELAALLGECRDSRRPYWHALAQTGNLDRLPLLLAERSRVTEEHVQDWVRQLARLVTNLADWKTLVLPAVSGLSIAHRLSLAALRLDVEDDKDRLALLSTLLTPTETEVGEICRAVAAHEGWSGMVTPQHREILKELTQTASGYQCQTATLALARLGEDVTAVAARLLVSGEQTDRQTALYAMHLAGADAWSNAVTALRDPDYHVRRVALDIVARSDNGATWTSIAPLAYDASAPVRQTWAELVAEKKYVEAIPILLHLLNDRRDRRPSSFAHASWPDHHVARAAAQALREFTLDHASVTACLGFLQGRGASQQEEDVEVDYYVLHALAAADDDRLIPFFSDLLDSGWHVRGQKDSGYPLRFAAAWCLASQLLRFPARAELVDPRALASAALHNDDRLAAPTLIALARVGEPAVSYLVEVARAEITNPERAMIAEASLPMGMTPAREALHAKVGFAHPARAWLDAASTDLPGAEEWPRWQKRFPTFASWLKTIQASQGLNPWLRFSLRLRCKGDAPPELLSKDKFTTMLPKPMGTISFRSMFGGE